MSADMALAGILDTAYAIVGDLDAQPALAIAVPLDILGTIVWYLRMTLDSIFVHMSDRYIAQGRFSMLRVSNVLLPCMFSGAILIAPAEYIFKGEAKLFLFCGFIIATCSELTLIEQVIVGLLTAFIYG